MVRLMGHSDDFLRANGDGKKKESGFDFVADKNT